MKKHKVERDILGYMNYRGEERVFHFDSLDFVLCVLSKSSEEWRTNSKKELVSTLEGGANVNPDERRWSKKEVYQGITINNYSIVFCIDEDQTHSTSTTILNVDWFYINSQGIGLNKIRKIQIEGGDVNYFFPSINSIKRTDKIDGNLSIKSVSVCSATSDKKSCGSYQLNKEIRADLYVYCAPFYNRTRFQMEVTTQSKLIIEFSSPIDIELAVKCFRDVYNFFRVIMYKPFPVFQDIFVFEDNKADIFKGSLFFPHQSKGKINQNLKNPEVIKYKILEHRSGKLVGKICNDELSLNKILEIRQGRHHYSILRIFSILAEFEKEYELAYGKNAKRSPAFIGCKEKAINILQEKSKEMHGKEKKYMKDFIRVLNNFDDTYKDRIINAIDKNKEIISPFIRKNYKRKIEESEYDSVVEELALRMNALRNNIAHEKLVAEIEAISLTDLKIVDELSYCICLKSIGIEDSKIKQAINDLFQENIQFSKIMS